MITNPGMLVDVILAFIVVGAVITGWRQGVFASLLSTVGVVAGLLCGVALAPVVMSYTDSRAFRFLLALGTVVLLVGLGNMLGGVAGSSLRSRMRMKSSQRWDSALGSVFQGITTLLVAWLIAIPLATHASGQFAEGLRTSRVLNEVDRVAPKSWESLPNEISAMLNESGLPPLFSPFDHAPNAEVAAPDPDIAHPEIVEQIRPSVVHVMGQASQCRHILSGSGFVVAPDYVFTNAHVVAGTESVQLDTVYGIKSADVVFYDPSIDVAVLHAPKLGLNPMQWAPSSAESGESAIVLGFPGSGPFTATSARVRERIMISGPDIYSNNRFDREAYTIRGQVRQGNSGGPMTNEEGQVLGMIFGAAVDSTDTGYALTADQVQKTVGEHSHDVIPVNTGECVAK